MANEYPKWVQRAPHIGAVLCLDADEEQKLLADWKAERAAAAKTAAEADAAEQALRDAEVLAAAEQVKAKHAKAK